MKKIRRIIVAALSFCMVSSLSAASVFAGDPEIITGQQQYVDIYANTSDEKNLTVEGDVISVDDDYGISVNVGASARGGTATATVHVTGDVDTNVYEYDIYHDNLPPSTITGVQASSTVDFQGTASAAVDVDKNVTAGWEQYKGTAVGINAQAIGEDTQTYFEANNLEPESSVPTASSTVNVDGNVYVSSEEYAKGINIGMYSDKDSKVVNTSAVVNGNVQVSAGEEALGIVIDPCGSHDEPTSTTIKVTGDVNVQTQGDGSNYAAGIAIADYYYTEYGPGYYGRYELVNNIGAEVTVLGSVNVDSGGLGYADAIFTMVDQESNVDISVSGDVSAVGHTSIGANIQAEGGSVVNISVGKDMHGDTNGASISVAGGSQAKLHVKGDLTGGDAGLVIYSEEEENNIIDVIVENTLSGGGEHTILVTKEEDLNALQLTVWKAEVNEDRHIISLSEEAAEDIDEEASEEINAAIEAKEQEFLYIIKVDQPIAGGTLSLSKENGNPLDRSPDYFNVAHQYEKVLLKVDVVEGYQITGAFNGLEKLSLYEGENNVYYVVVPKGGGVYLTATLAKEPGPEKKRKPSEEKEEQKPVQQTVFPESQPMQTVLLESQPLPAAQPVPAAQPPVQENSVPQGVKLVLEKDDMKPGAKITFFDNGTFVVRRNDAAATDQRLNGTFAVKNGVIELILSDGIVRQIDKDGTLILQTGGVWKDYRSLPDDELGTCRFEFSSDDLNVLLSSLTDVSLWYLVHDTASALTMMLYKNGVYKVTYNDQTDRSEEYGIFRIEKQEETGKEEIIFTNTEGEEMIVGDDDVLHYLPLHSGSLSTAEEVFTFKISRENIKWLLQ